MTDTIDSANPTVEWAAPDGGEWSLEAAHGSNLPAVTIRDLMARPFAEGTRAGLAPLGLPLSHIEMRYVNGWPYVSFFLHDVPRKAGPPPAPWLLKAITRLHPGFRRRTKIARRAIEEGRAEAVAASWAAERAGWIERLLAVQQVSLSELDDPGLADHLEVVREVGEDAFRRHFELIFGCIPLGNWLARAATWGVPADLARSAVMHGTPIHEAARRRLARIADALGDATPSALDEVRAHGTEAAEALDDYLLHHGCWATEDDVRATVLADHPDAILTSILRQRSAAPTTADDPAALLRQLRDRVPATDHAEFDRLADAANRSYMMLDDNSGILGSWAAGVVGRALQHTGARLAGDGRLEQADDLWALPFEEVVALVRGAGPASSAEIADRAAAWRRLGELDPPRHLGGEPSPPPDPSVFPAPVAQLMTGVGAFLADKFNDDRAVFGVGSTPARGRAVVVEHASEALDRLEPGDILVTIATTPAFNTVLGIAGGVVVSEGGPSCHTAVVARELGVPAIVGYTGAVERITDGAIIEIDPVAATVTALAASTG